MFQVSEIFEPNIIWGRNCGESIRIGMCFNRLRIRVFELPDKEGILKLINKQYSLKVTGIHYAQKDTDELWASHSGGLVFRPKDVEEIKEQLGKLGKNEYLELYAE